MQVNEIKLSEIATSALNPRKTFDETELKELAQSIEANGLIQPVTVRKINGKDGKKYEIVCGERRFRAVTLLGKATIQAVVKDLDDKQAFACMVIENLQRKDIDPMEEAQALKYLYNKGAVSVKEIAKMLGKSQSFVVNRIQLNNIIPEFVAFLREGVLNLVHLQIISNLRKDQQKMLLELRFQPSHIERWETKTPKVETLKAWIDESVMGLLSSAHFNPDDETYVTCKETTGCLSCKGCKFCTATFPTRFKETDNPRCMNIELYRLKNQEAVLRKAKESGLPLVYAGSKEDNATIISAANDMLMYPQPLGSREYLVVPEPPVMENFSDEEKYNLRYQSYERVRGVFDDNIKAGLVVEVFEVSYHGNLSGDVKYLYNVKTDENGDADRIQEAQANRLTEIRTQLRTVEEKKQEDRVERQRAFIEGSPSFSEKPEAVDEVEENVFLALLASRLPAAFRKNIGLDLESSKDMSKTFERISSIKDVIMREFIRTMLSDKQVCYSQGFANLLDITMNHTYSEDVAVIDKNLAAEYQKKCETYEKTISELEAALEAERSKSTEEEEVTEMPAEEASEAPVDELPSDTESAPQEASNEATEVANGDTEQPAQPEA